MEHPTTFNLNCAIQNWRDELTQSPALRTENLDELESHLRDSITLLQKPGLSTEEAFMVSAKRIGNMDSLQREFGKINAHAVWLDRFFWMLIGVQVFSLVNALFNILTQDALICFLMNTSGYFLDHARSMPIVICTVVEIAAWMASFALCWWLIHRKGKSVGARINPLLQRRTTLIATCIGLCVLMFGAEVLIHAIQAFCFNFMRPTNIGEFSNCVNYAYPINRAIQTIAMITVTLVIARKLFRSSENIVRD